MTPVNGFIGSPKTLHPSSPCPGPAQHGDRKISLLPFLPPLSLAFIKHLLHAKCRSRFFHASARHFTRPPRKPPQKSSIFYQLNAAPLSFFRFVSWRHRSLGPLASYILLSPAPRQVPILDLPSVPALPLRPSGAPAARSSFEHELAGTAARIQNFKGFLPSALYRLSPLV